MVNARMKIHLLLANNNRLDTPITFYEMYQKMCFSDPESTNPDTNEKMLTHGLTYQPYYYFLANSETIEDMIC